MRSRYVKIKSSERFLIAVKIPIRFVKVESLLRYLKVQEELLLRLLLVHLTAPVKISFCYWSCIFNLFVNLKSKSENKFYVILIWRLLIWKKTKMPIYFTFWIQMVSNLGNSIKKLKSRNCTLMDSQFWKKFFQIKFNNSYNNDQCIHLSYLHFLPDVPSRSWTFYIGSVPGLNYICWFIVFIYIQKIIMFLIWITFIDLLCPWFKI